MILKYLSETTLADEAGINAGYSDASVSFIPFDAPFDQGRTFKEQMLLWNPGPSGPIGIAQHLEAYRWFDRQ